MSGRIGIYPGTFDPVHPGHLAFAREAQRVCGLDEVVFLPEQEPRGKQRVTALAHRVALLKRATAGQPGLRVVRLTSKQFTVAQTLPELTALFKDTSFTLLLGSDVVRTFPYRWEGLQTLFQAVSLAVGLRGTDDDREIQTLLTEVSQTYSQPIQYTVIRTADADAASSRLRGSNDLSRLHPSVLTYIREHGLYGQDATPAT